MAREMKSAPNVSHSSALWNTIIAEEECGHITRRFNSYVFAVADQESISIERYEMNSAVSRSRDVTSEVC